MSTQAQLLTDLVVELGDLKVRQPEATGKPAKKSRPFMIYWTMQLKVICCIQLI